jgi:L-ascorbate metabolism protein UlaG (beta-lactamase superfamily)
VSDLRVTHIGGPTVLLEIEGWRLLTDPTFDPPGRRYSFGWGTSSRKLTGPAMTADELGPIDAVLLTHDHHADNLDDAGRRLLPSVGDALTTVAGARRLGAPVRGLAPWDVTTLSDDDRPTIHVTATPCRHGPPGSRPIVGDVVGFSLRWDGQRHGEVWITGDTVLYKDLRQVSDRLDVGTAIVHLGGVRFPVTGPVRYTMTARQVIDLLTPMHATTIVPVHYEGWTHFREGREAIEDTLAAAPASVSGRVRWASIGEPLVIDV